MDSPFLQGRRPMPPTPRAMATGPPRFITALNQPTQRMPTSQVSTTCIPRPVSGTSRRASLTYLSYSSNVDLSDTNREVLDSPSNNHQHFSSPHRSFIANNRMPPVSFPRNGPATPFSRSTSPRVLGACSSPVKPQFPLRNYSKLILNHQDRLNESALNSKVALLGEPRISRHLSSPAKEAPQHSLLRPIPPPLTRSQTTGNLACLGSHQEFSPSKPVRKVDLRQQPVSEKFGKEDIIVRRMESELGRSNDKTPEQIYESMTESWQLIEQITSSISSPKKTTRDTTICQSENQPHELRSPHAKTHMIGSDEQLTKQSKTPLREPCYVDTKLANSCNTQSGPQSCSAPHTVTPSRTAPSFEGSFDLRQVYHAEDTPYWLGRFFAIRDRLRQSDCDMLLQSQEGSRKLTHVSSQAFEDECDRLEATRNDRALSKLKEYCRSPSAIRSFDRFLSQFLVSESVVSENDRPRLSATRLEKDDTHKKTMKGIPYPSPRPGAKRNMSSSTSSQLVDSSAQGTVSRISELISKRGGLVKSKTTGSLMTLPNPLHQSTTTAPRLADKPNSSNETSEKRQKSASITLSKTRAMAIEERESRPRMQATFRDPSVTKPRLSGRSTSIPSIHDRGIPLSHSNSSQKATGLVPRDIEIVPNVTVTALENGHGPPPAPTSPTVIRTNPIMVDGEKVLYNRREGGRKSSGQTRGELMKKLVGTGIREVRKMSRRVGSMGWNGSSEDSTEPKA